VFASVVLVRFPRATPPAFPLVDLPRQIDDDLVREAARLLLEAVSNFPTSAMTERDSRDAVFAAPMAKLCVDARLQRLPVERLIVAVKQAWALLGDTRARLGDAAPDVLASAISVCIEQYFPSTEHERQR
jgi:hypothetical protein